MLKFGLFIQDFDHFPSQRDFFMGTNKYIADMLVTLTGDRWKTMRTLATPVFTSGRLKAMVPLIDTVLALSSRDYRIVPIIMFHKSLSGR